MWTYIIIGIIVLGIIGMVQQANSTSQSKQDEEKELADKYGLNVKRKLFSAKYLGGHPFINDSCYLRIFEKETELILVKFFLVQVPDEKFGVNDNWKYEVLATISLDNIKDITFENASTFKSRVTAGRLLLVGALALAWKKNELHENAYLIIKWNDGRFNHETLFEFTGKGAIEAANTARNNLFRTIQNSEKLV